MIKDSKEAQHKHKHKTRSTLMRRRRRLWRRRLLARCFSSGLQQTQLGHGAGERGVLHADDGTPHKVVSSDANFFHDPKRPFASRELLIGDQNNVTDGQVAALALPFLPSDQEGDVLLRPSSPEEVGHVLTLLEPFLLDRVSVRESAHWHRRRRTQKQQVRWCQRCGVTTVAADRGEGSAVQNPLNFDDHRLQCFVIKKLLFDD